VNVEKVVEDKTKCHLNYEQRCLNLAKKRRSKYKRKYWSTLYSKS